jgi:hypothetical protein
VACYGYSAGGFAALHYGVDLSALAVLALSGAYYLERDLLIRGSLRSQSYRQHPLSERPVNLREVYAQAADPPEVLLLYGDRNPIDRLQAEYLAGADKVKLVALRDCSTHLVTVELIKRGALAPLLRWLADGSIESYANGLAALSA